MTTRVEVYKGTEFISLRGRKTITVDNVTALILEHGEMVNIKNGSESYTVIDRSKRGAKTIVFKNHRGNGEFLFSASRNSVEKRLPGKVIYGAKGPIARIINLGR